MLFKLGSSRHPQPDRQHVPRRAYVRHGELIQPLREERGAEAQPRPKPRRTKPFSGKRAADGEGLRCKSKAGHFACRV